MRKEHILVIKHGALGDVVLSTAPFAAIRKHHPDAHITLLTAAPYHKMLADAPYFDEIWLDEKPKAWQIIKLSKLIQSLRSRNWTMVYDLQTSGRTTRYFDLFAKPKPKWSGVVDGCSHDCNTPHRADLHSLDRQQEQLAIAGINYEPKPDVSWLKSDISSFGLSSKYALIIAGGAAHRPEKRWTKEGFAEFAIWLIGQGIQPVLIGTDAEREAIEYIEVTASKGQSIALLNLCGNTSIADLAELGRGAELAIGNDTGPIHLIAASGCPSIVLFSKASNPDLCAPRGDNVQIIQKDDLSDLDLAEVIKSVSHRLE